MLTLFRPTSPEMLHAIIRNALGMSIPTKAVCPGHAAPFSFVSDSYFEKTNNCMVIGPRMGGKTMNFAVLEFLESAYKSGCESCHLGAIMAQAKRAYKYISMWANSNKDDLQIGTLTREKTEMGNGSMVEIVPGTVNGVNSPHPHKALIDEFELLEWEIFQQAISMPKSNDSIAAALRLATTRKYPNGNAQRMIEEADKRGYEVYKWCVFEVMQRCTGNCSNCKRYITYNRNGKPVKWADICRGKAKNSDGYLAVDDVIKKFLTLDWEVFESEWLCRRPERSDCVFPEFNYDRNVIDRPPTITDDMQIGRGWDFGYDDPTACIFFAWDAAGNIFVIEEYVQSGKLIEDVATEIRKRSDRIAKPEQWTDWGDPSGSARTGVNGYSYMDNLARQLIYVNSQHRSPIDGIQLVQKKLRPSSFTGHPQLYVTKHCRRLISALELAQWDRTKGEAVHSREKYKHDEHSHPLDALRYFIAGQFGESQISIGL